MASAPRKSPGRLGEVTRNAVIGKVHRLGLPCPAKTVASARRIRPRERPVLAVQMRAKTPAGTRTRPLPPDLPPLPRTRSSACAVTDAETRAMPLAVGDPRLPGFGFCGLRTARAIPIALTARCSINPAAMTAEGA